MSAKTIKRSFDLILSILLLPIWLPAIAICALLIKLDSQGSIFFLQERIGLNGTPFQVIKLRTMVPNAEKIGAGLYTEKNDPRFTKIGLFLRRFSLDELPQFINVITGDMSIVGPRPLPKTIVKRYQNDFDIILKVKPGITGLAQVEGRNKLTRKERLSLDKYYVQNWSLIFDVQVLLKTIKVILTGDGQINYIDREDVD